MRALFLLLFILCGQNLAVSKESWKCVKIEVHKVSYNIYINQWFKEKTLDIDVLEPSIDTSVDKARIVFKNVSDSVIYFGLNNLEYYKFSNGKRMKKLQNNINVTSLMYEVKPHKNANIPFYLCCMDSAGMFLVRVKMKGSDYLKYYIDVYLEKTEE